MSDAPHPEIDAEPERPSDPRSRRQHELNRLYLAVVLAVGVWVIFGGYTVLSARVDAGLGEATKVSLLAVGMLNVLAIGTLFFIMARALAKLYFERRKGILGARIRTRLVLSIFAVTILPSLLLFIAGRRFISKNIDRWFLPETQAITLHAKTLADATRQQLQQRLFAALAAAPPQGELATLRKEASLDCLIELDPFAASLAPQLPMPELPRSPGFHLQNTPQGTWCLALNAGSPNRVVGIFLPKALADALGGVDRYEKEADQIHRFRQPLETLPQDAFLFLTLLTLFAAVWVGLTLSRTISEPVRTLAKAAQRVGAGDLEIRLPEQGEDELAMLSRAFNTMIRDLRLGREAVEAQAERIGQQRAYLGQLLEALPVGVLSWQRDGELRTFNPAARAWLGLPDTDPLEQTWAGMTQSPRLGELPALVAEVRATRKAKVEELRLGGEGEGRPVRAIVIPLEGSGELAVLEDLSPLAQAEKRAAWQEVARRMAHEVKNPLTPIQLTAQRLLRRSREGRLDPTSVAEGAETILVEVSSLARLVDSFSRFAKLPAPHLKTLDACELMRQVEALYAPSHPEVRFTVDLETCPVAVRWDADMVKRALINFVDNAIAAQHGKGRVRLALSLSSGRVRLDVEDAGPGVPPESRALIFEPYFSTKHKGTGLGLAIARRIAEEHGGEALYEAPEMGSRFSLILPMEAQG